MSSLLNIALITVPSNSNAQKSEKTLALPRRLCTPLACVIAQREGRMTKAVMWERGWKSSIFFRLTSRDPRTDDIIKKTGTGESQCSSIPIRANSTCPEDVGGYGRR